MNKEDIGYYDSADQKEPTYNPPMVTECPVCYKQVVSEDNMRTYSISDFSRSYFYRMHRTCAETLSDTELGMYDQIVFDLMNSPTHKSNKDGDT